MIRNILGGFLFSGDDIYKKAGVLSGGERTRLAVARMLLRPSNTLLLDEPTNHLDLDSKDVLLDALDDFGGTLIFVSHDRYFVDRLATKIIEVGHGGVEVYPGTYERVPVEQGSSRAPQTEPAAASLVRSGSDGPSGRRSVLPRRRSTAGTAGRQGQRQRHLAPPRTPHYEDKKQADAERGDAASAPEHAKSAGRRARGADRRTRNRDQGTRSARCPAPASTKTAEAADRLIDPHQALMWEVGDLMKQWEALRNRGQKTSPATILLLFCNYQPRL